MLFGEKKSGKQKVWFEPSSPLTPLWLIIKLSFITPSLKLNPLLT